MVDLYTKYLSIILAVTGINFHVTDSNDPEYVKYVHTTHDEPVTVFKLVDIGDYFIAFFVPTNCGIQLHIRDGLNVRESLEYIRDAAKAVADVQIKE